MAYEIVEIKGEFVHFRISGLMQVADQLELQKLANNLIKSGLKPKLLVVAENFQGWEKSEAWNDVDFMLHQGNAIAKMAIVAEAHWQDEIAMFTGKGFRATAIEVFLPDSIVQAEHWLHV
jgi:hypothetical protein